MPASGTTSSASSTLNTTVSQPISVNLMPEFNPSKDNWFYWKERLEIHFDEIECTEEKQQRTVLLKFIGIEAYAVVRSLCDPKLPKDVEYTELCQYLESQYTPTVIIFRERKRFFDTEKESEETVSAWFARIKNLASKCKFGSSLDTFVLNKFVCGLSGKLFERLCEEDEKLTIKDALKKALIAETKIRAKEGNDSGVNFVRQKGRVKRSGANGTVSGANGEPVSKKRCTHCGWGTHQSDSCRFKRSKCHYCGSIGHLASVCIKKSKQINYIDSDSESEGDCDCNNENFSNVNFSQIKAKQSSKGVNSCDFSIYTVHMGNEQSAKMKDSESCLSVLSEDVELGSSVYVLPVEFNGVKLDITCDTGAPLNLMSIKMFDKFFSRRSLRPCSLPFTAYGGHKIKTCGEFSVPVTYRGLTKDVSFIVTDTTNSPLLARSFLRKFGFDLVQVDSQVNSVRHFDSILEKIKRDFRDIFDGKLGAYNVAKVHLSIDKEAKPIFFKPRPVPFAWKSKIEEQLNKLVESGVLELVNNSNWGCPIVPIPKPNGELRICGDYKVTINKFLTDFKYPLPRIEEIFASLQGGQLFTKLDLSNAYNQLILDDESQELCAWSTHIGIFKMKRLPFGVKPAGPIFQQTMEKLLSDIPNVINYMDDIVITGPSFESHVNTLMSVLSKLQGVGLKLNLDKCAFFQKKNFVFGVQH